METLITHLIEKHHNSYNNLMYKHYAIICESKNLDNIYSRGTNQLLDTAILKQFSIHAEMDAINKFKKLKHLHTNKIDIISIRLSNVDNIGNSKPCCYCLKYLKDSKLNIKFIIYYENNKFIKKTLKELLDTPHYIPKSVFYSKYS